MKSTRRSLAYPGRRFVNLRPGMITTVRRWLAGREEMPSAAEVARTFAISETVAARYLAAALAGRKGEAVRGGTLFP